MQAGELGCGTEREMKQAGPAGGLSAGRRGLGARPGQGGARAGRGCVGGGLLRAPRHGRLGARRSAARLAGHVRQLCKP